MIHNNRPRSFGVPCFLLLYGGTMSGYAFGMLCALNKSCGGSAVPRPRSRSLMRAPEVLACEGFRLCELALTPVWCVSGRLSCVFSFAVLCCCCCSLLCLSLLFLCWVCFGFSSPFVRLGRLAGVAVVAAVLLFWCLSWCVCSLSSRSLPVCVCLSSVCRLVVPPVNARAIGWRPVPALAYGATCL